MRSTFIRIIILSLCIIRLEAQVTTASMNGRVTTLDGSPLESATVLARHVTSGSIYGTSTRADGRFNLPNLRVGGPYTVEVTYVGFENEIKSDIFLALAQKLNLEFKLKESTVSLGQVEILGDAGIINSKRTGASTEISRDLLNVLPTISRSASDFTRLNPMAAEGGSFGGRNDQFNNYSLDGAIFNNPFGLDAATPGGQADAQPVSLDAIDQIKVSIAPYDVTQSGFTGASINAVTRSGTNKFGGTAYYFFRNKNMTGGKIDGTQVNRGDLRSSQVGASISGPIIKDKLFFFANFEIEKRSDLGSYYLANRGSSGANVSRVLASDLQKVSDLLKSLYGYETGSFENFKHNSDNTKALLKVDFNINKNHKLSATYSFLDAFKDKPAHPSAIGRRGPDFQTLQFQNSGYRINNGINSGIIELKSIFGNKYANKLQVGLTSFKDNRDPFSAAFPVINIGKDGTRYIVAGHEPFSIHNVLDQQVLQINEVFNIYSGKHNFTIGTNFEKFQFDNSFNLTGYGSRVFFPDIAIGDVESVFKSNDFKAEVAAARKTGHDNKWALAETNVGQWSAFIQDEWELTKKLTMTAGLRLDVPLYFDTKEKMIENLDPARNCCYDPTIQYYNEEGAPVKLDSKVFPKSTPLINPRVGFNYDISGDKSEQFRGGSGLFSGRFPFVWVGNQVANPNSFFYCVTDPDFKFPQIWRTDIGYDRKLFNGWIGSLDIVYTKDLQSQIIKNYGLKLPTGKLSGVDTRPIYLNSDRAQNFGAATNAYVFTNDHGGYAFNTSIQMEKTWKNSFVKFGYNYLNAKDVSSIDAEISSDGYDRNPANIQHTNRPELAPSLYGNRHRLLGTASHRFDYSKGKMATTISLFVEYVEGTRYSYTYSGDINNDGSSLNDLIYIPTDANINSMNFTGDATSAGIQRNALKNYIAQDQYLSEHRGTYAEKYGALAPWYSHWDIRALQDFKLNNDQVVQVSLDILNVGNMLNSSWGVRQYATYTGLAQPLAVSVSNGIPVYTFDASQNNTFFNDFSLLSRWQLQLGLRYRF
ncbi:MAG: carboxypeptidase regulatory-like domain-containing protein [Saprospiraceae bacterium]